MAANEDIVNTLYQILLGREADEIGLRDYSENIEQGESAFAVATALRNSDEFARRLHRSFLTKKILWENAPQDANSRNYDRKCQSSQVDLDFEIALIPKIPSAYYRRGLLFEELDRFKEAIVCFDLAICLEPNFVEAHCRRSAALRRVGQTREALDAAKRAMTLAPNNMGAVCAYALTLATSKTHDALDFLVEAVATHPDSLNLRLALGNIFEGLDRDEEAVDAYRAAIALGKLSPEPHYRLGQLLEAKGDAGNALLCYKNAVALAPNHFDSRFRLGALLAHKIGPVKAQSDLSIGVEMPQLEALTFILYSETSENDLDSQLGCPEYSYFFVRESFRKMLQKHGKVVVVTDPETEVDLIFDSRRKAGEKCIFLSFAPPHRSFVTIRCPTIPVFAWEFDTIPTEDCGGGRLDDWRRALSVFGCAIVHSRYALNAVSERMYPGFPVISIPAPIWDQLRQSMELSTPVKGIDHSSVEITAHQLLDCPVISGRRHAEIHLESKAKTAVRFEADEIVYTAVFNPADGRKNWRQLIRAFCIACADVPTATLVLKLINKDCISALREVKSILSRMPEFDCRVVAIGDHLSNFEYERLVSASSFVINTSFAEGQCLPLMEFMSRGKPAIAPRHTSMEEYVDESNSFVIDSVREPCAWPHDVNHKIRAHRYRISWDSALEAIRASLNTVRNRTDRYKKMSEAAVERQRLFCSEEIALERLQKLIGLKFELEREIALSVEPPVGS